MSLAWARAGDSISARSCGCGVVDVDPLLAFGGFVAQIMEAAETVGFEFVGHHGLRENVLQIGGQIARDAGHEDVRPSAGLRRRRRRPGPWRAASAGSTLKNDVLGVVVFKHGIGHVFDFERFGLCGPAPGRR